MNNVMLAQLMKDMQVRGLFEFRLASAPAGSSCDDAFDWLMRQARKQASRQAKMSFIRHVSSTASKDDDRLTPRNNKQAQEETLAHSLALHSPDLFSSFLIKDPEMMKEAAKLQQDPAFQAYMQRIMNQAGFQKAMREQQQKLRDPVELKRLEERAAAALQEGNAALEKLEKERIAKQKKRCNNNDDDQKEKGEDDQKEEEEDKKEAAAVEEEPTKEVEEDDLPDIPALNIN
jgi:hypothetical protein